MSTNSGDIDAVKIHQTHRFERAVTNGVLPQPMLERIGGDVSGLAEQFVNGETPERLRVRLVTVVLNQEVPESNFGGCRESDANASGTIGSDTNANTDNGFGRAGNPSGLVGVTNPDSQQVAQEQPMTTPTPTTEPTATATTRPTTAVPIQKTCNLYVLYNLNLRAEPNLDAEWIMTIPFTSIITTYGSNEDDWWQVEYEDEIG